VGGGSLEEDRTCPKMLHIKIWRTFAGLEKESLWISAAIPDRSLYPPSPPRLWPWPPSIA
jgi:hypothetical protein